MMGSVVAERSMIRTLPAICPFGRYELLGRLAVGGMAEIYLAREPAMVEGAEPRHLVIKRILQHVADDEVFLQMFFDEARLQQRLRHPGIIHVYEFGEEQGSYYLAMEWVDGIALGKLIRRARDHGGIPPPIVVKTIARVAEALHYAHCAKDDMGQPLGIVHRDVSPQNIMISYEGAVKLLDFGIAKASTHHTKTQEGQVKGKFAYMAPEQCLGEPMDGRADVFALGVCLYEALTGRPLYHRKTQYETMRAVIESAVPSIRKLEPDLPEELDAIVQKALQKHAQDRFASAGDMQMALERWLVMQQEIVAPPRIAELLEGVFDEEIRRGPTVSSTPFGESFQLGHPQPPEDSSGGKGLPPLISSPTPEALAAGGIISAEVVDAPPAFTDLDPLPAPPKSKAPLVVALLLLLLAVGGTVAYLVVATGEEPVATTQPPTQAPTPTQEQATPTPQPVPVPTHDPTAPAPARGSVTFRSEPAGAVVWLDGDRVPGETPTTLGDVEPGEYDARVELEGYRDWRGRVTVRPGAEAEVEAELRRARVASGMGMRRRPPPASGEPGSLAINTRPWSKVYVGNRLLGTTPIGRAEVPSGQVNLRIVDRDGNEHRRSVSVMSGETTRLFYDLSSIR